MSATQLLYLVFAVQVSVVAVGWAIAGLRLRLAPAAAAYWAVFCLSAAVSALTGLLLNGAHIAWLIALANLTLVGALTALWRGLGKFLQLSTPLTPDLLAVLAALIVGLADAAGVLSTPLRGTLISAICSLCLLRSSLVTARPIRAEFGWGAALLVSGPQFAVALLFAARVLRALLPFGQDAVPPPTAPSTVNYLTVVSLTCFVSLFNVVLAVMAVTRVTRELNHLSQHDPLTGLANRRTLSHALSAEQARGSAHGGTCAVLMVDIDHFKQINDRHGHAAGDAVLVRVAAVLREHVRPTDTVARTGGEEFCILAPMTDLDRAGHLADRLLQAVSREVARPDGAPLTVSIGCTSRRLGLDFNGETLIAQADALLYRAKQQGRNRVELAASPVRVSELA
ncbi:diguanylate cyclase [Burkholderiaceae bacterium UC74_6]